MNVLNCRSGAVPASLVTVRELSEAALEDSDITERAHTRVQDTMHIPGAFEPY